MLLRALTRIIAIALLTSGVAFAQALLSPGRDFVLLNSPQPTDSTGPEVLEFFSYGCIHCYHLESKLDPWVKQLPKDVKFSRVPAFKLRGIDSAPIYYSFEAMGLLDKLHIKLFEAVHNDNLTAGNATAFYQWLTKQGVDIKKYQEIEKSFSVQSKASRARLMAENYKIESTPTLALNGKYLVINQTSTDRTFQVLDTLIATSRQAKPAVTGKN